MKIKNLLMKIAALSLALVLCISLAACRTAEKEPDDTSGSSVVDKNDPNTGDSGETGKGAAEGADTDTNGRKDSDSSVSSAAESAFASDLEARFETLPFGVLGNALVSSLTDGTINLKAIVKSESVDSDAYYGYSSSDSVDLDLDLTIRSILSSLNFRAAGSLKGAITSSFTFDDPDYALYNSYESIPLDISFDALINDSRIAFTLPTLQGYLGIDYDDISSQLSGFLLNLGMSQAEVDEAIASLEESLASSLPTGDLSGFDLSGLENAGADLQAAVEKLMSSVESASEKSADGEDVSVVFIKGSAFAEYMRSYMKILFSIVPEEQTGAYDLDEMLSTFESLDSIALKVYTKADRLTKISADISAEGENVTFTMDFGKSALDDWKLIITAPNGDTMEVVWSIASSGSTYTHTISATGAGVNEAAQFKWDSAKGGMTLTAEGQDYYLGSIRAVAGGAEVSFDSSSSAAIFGELADSLGAGLDGASFSITLKLSSGGDSIPNPSYQTPDKWDMNTIMNIISVLGEDLANQLLGAMGGGSTDGSIY